MEENKNRAEMMGRKEEYVRRIFSSIAEHYDLLNSLLSFGLHHSWKKFAVEKASLKPGGSALDICSGTGDLAVLLARKVGPLGKVVALDLSEEMLALGENKARLLKVDRIVNYVNGRAEDLKFSSGSFDAATVGFGMRNVTSITRTFQEMHRVLREGGRAVCLEFSHPTNRAWKAFYDLYSFEVIPRVGRLVSKDASAYSYLPSSIRQFPDQESLKSIMQESGFEDVHYYNLAGGIVAVHVGVK